MGTLLFRAWTLPWYKGIIWGANRSHPCKSHLVHHRIFLYNCRMLSKESPFRDLFNRLGSFRFRKPQDLFHMARICHLCNYLANLQHHSH